jgi:hypothetical protein
LRGREFPLPLEGTAWLDKQTGQVIAIEASLMSDMSDIGLRSLRVHVDYKPVELAKSAGTLTLPARAVVDVATPRQHWRNTHDFSSYKSFSTDAEQGTDVKVHTNKPSGEGVSGDDKSQSDQKEKP